jgi:Tfp pilus assembly protein PilW
VTFPRDKVQVGRLIGENMTKSRLGYRGQSTLESTIALVAAVILLLGITQVFVWVNRTMVGRHQAFRSTQFNTTPVVDFYTPEELDIFGAQ